MSQLPSRTPVGRALKRILDLLVVFPGLVVLSPILLLVALTILLVDGRPVLFTQPRIGLGNKPFVVYKFRTMRRGSDRDPLGSVSVTSDHRLLPGASILRKFKLDELPQILNILGGSMSLVGPRPTVQEDVDRMTVEQRRRHEVLPGMTGLAQINGNARLLWPARIAFDIQYAENWSMWNDIRILFKTFFLIIAGGADTPPDTPDEWGDTISNKV